MTAIWSHVTCSGQARNTDGDNNDLNRLNGRTAMPMISPKWVDVDEINTRYFESGEGEAVVLFYGGNFGSKDGSNCALAWELNFDGLAANCWPQA